jgi:hypothetical protein
MIRQALLFLLASSASAFVVTSPFGGYRAFPQQVLKSQLLSEPNGVTESVDESVVTDLVEESVVEVTEPVDEPAIAEIASEGITEESTEGSVEKKSSKPPQKDDKDRFTAFVGNLPFSKLRITTILLRKTGSEYRLLYFF